MRYCRVRDLRISDGRALIAGGGSSGYTVGSTYGEKTHRITTNEMPSHNHSASTASNGDHSHKRGTMEITGSLTATDTSGDYPEALVYADSITASGALKVSNAKTIKAWEIDDRTSNATYNTISFKASEGWSGETEYKGAHTHTVTVNSTGGTTAMSLVQPSQAVARWLRTA